MRFWVFRSRIRIVGIIAFVLLIGILFLTLINLHEELGGTSQSELSSSKLNDTNIVLRDDFSSGMLGVGWSWQSDSQGISSWSLSTNPGHLRITSPKVPTSWQWEVTDVPYMYQTLSVENWQIEIHVNEPTANEFANGIILYKDFNYWMIFANSVDSVGEMNLLRIKEGTVPDNICGGGRGYNMPYLRLKKMGSLYSCYGSTDGNTWIDLGSCYTSTSYVRMGIWAQSHWSGTFTSDFDYFYFEELVAEPPLPDPNEKQPVWDYDTGNIVYAVEMTPDGQSIVAGNGNSVLLWDKDSSSPLWTYYTGDVVTAVDISDDGNYIVSVGGILDHPGNIFLWDRGNPTPLWKFTGIGNFESIAISADGQFFAAGDRLSNQLHFWHRSSSVPLWSFSAGSGNWESVAISADGKYLVAADGFYHNYVYFFDTTSSTPIWSYRCGSDVWSVDITPDGQYITASSKDQRIYLWEKSSATPLWAYPTGSEAFSVSISDTGGSIAGGGRDGKVHLFNWVAQTPVWSCSLGSEVWAERAVSISGNGEYIGVGTLNAKIFCFHRTNPDTLWDFSTLTGEVQAVALSENGQYLVAGGKDHRVYLFENFESQEPPEDIVYDDGQEKPVLSCPSGMNVWSEGKKFYVNISFHFRSHGFRVEWGEIIRRGQDFEVNVKVWQFNGPVPLVLVDIYKSQIFELGELESGIYHIECEVWNIVMRNLTFEVSNISSIYEPPFCVSIIGSVTAGTMATYTLVRSRRREKRINTLLSRISNESAPANLQIADPLAISCDVQGSWLEPVTMIESSNEPLIEGDRSERQDYAGNLAGFEFTFLFKISNAIMKSFPGLNQMSEGPAKLIYVKDLMTLNIEEQLALFKHLILQNSENSIRLELDKLMIETNHIIIRENFDYLLPKLNDCVDIVQMQDKKELLADTYIFLIMIKNGFS